MAQQTKAQQYVSDKVRQAFAEMDKDGDGLVTYSEFTDFCRRVPGMSTLAEAFCEIDTSNDNRISLEELNALCMKVPPKKMQECHIIDLFHCLDKSGDGKLDKNEFRALMKQGGYSEDVIQATFDHVSGGDGEITLEEFLACWRKG